MKFLVLGTTGRTGKWILSHGLARGHQVVALVRDATKLAPQDGLTVIQGQPIDAEALATAAQGCDAVLVALNNPRTSDAPWAKPQGDAPILTQTAEAIVKAGIKRVVFLSALGVGDSFADAPWILRFLIRRTNLGHAYADHNGAEQAFRASSLDWTLVRASGLSDGDKAKSLVVGTAKSPRPSMSIRRSTVAGFMLDCAEKGQHIRETPVISER